MVLLLGRIHVQVAAIQEGVGSTQIAPLLEEELVEEIFVRKYCDCRPIYYRHI